jgi:hypothetical protein
MLAQQKRPTSHLDAVSQLASSSPAAQLTRPDTVKAGLTPKRPRGRHESGMKSSKLVFTPRQPSSNAGSNAIGRRWITAHRGEREDPGPVEGPNEPERLSAWVRPPLDPRVRPCPLCPIGRQTGGNSRSRPAKPTHDRAGTGQLAGTRPQTSLTMGQDEWRLVLPLLTRPPIADGGLGLRGSCLRLPFHIVGFDDQSFYGIQPRL